MLTIIESLNPIKYIKNFNKIIHYVLFKLINKKLKMNSLISKYNPLLKSRSKIIKKKNINIKCNKITKRMKDIKKLKDHPTTQKISKTDLILYKYIKDNKEIDYNDENLIDFSKEEIDNRVIKLNKYIKQLQELKKLPYIKQRSEEWFNLRKNRLTASDLEDAIKGNNIKLAKKKAGVIKDTTNYSEIPPLKWGVMFEPMATRCYSQANNDILISEFGLIADKTLEHFGASPDGINDMGIMIEIKCPYSREIIDNSIPDKYYTQIQGQLAVCELEECDYIECDFQTYTSPYIYIDYITNDLKNINYNHGIIAEYKNKETGEYIYLYSEEYLKASNAFDNINKQMYEANKDENLIFIKLTPWVLRKMNIQRVSFDNENWNNNIVPKINTFWEKVEECKNLPIEEPVRKQKITFIEDDD